MWVWPPTAVWRAPPTPKATGGPFPPARALPPPPSLSSPTPLALFAMLRDGRPGLAWGRRLTEVVGEGPPSGTWGQTHICWHSKNALVEEACVLVASVCKLLTMLGVVLSDHIPGDLNLTLTLTTNSN